jgi:hypothetical protein
VIQDLACPTASTCYVTGSDDVAEHCDNGTALAGFVPAFEQLPRRLTAGASRKTTPVPGSRLKSPTGAVLRAAWSRLDVSLPSWRFSTQSFWRDMRLPPRHCSGSTAPTLREQPSGFFRFR